MIEVRKSAEFTAWVDGLRDRKGRAIILTRVERMADGVFGDVGPVGEGVSELRIHIGPGYRVYFVREGAAVVVVLGGGDKSTQDRDIKRAKKLAGKG